MASELGGRIHTEQGEALSIPVAPVRNEIILRKFAELRRIPGQLVGEGSIEPWPILGSLQQEGQLLLYGPYRKGVFLERLTGGSLASILPYLIRLVRALLTLKRKGSLIEGLQTDSVYFCEDGSVLFLPSALMKEVRNLHPEPYRVRVFESINHPDLREPEERLSFSVAALLYRGIHGRYPFEAVNEEEIHNRVRHARIIPSALLEPGLREDLSESILAGLGRGERGVPSLEEWEEILTRCRREGPFRTITEEQRERLAEAARKQRQSADRAYRRQVFWQRNWKTVAITAVAVIVVGVLAGSYLKRVLAPRATHGYSPEQVVKTFYDSMNTLDHALMEDCVVEGAGKDTIREVMNLFVMSRVRQGYEGQTYVVPADEWDRQGRPDLPPPNIVYGVTDLKMVPEQGEPQPIFLVRYTKWVPLAGEEPGTEDQSGQAGGQPAAGARFTSIPITERVYLKQDHADWVIFRIQRLQPQSPPS